MLYFLDYGGPSCFRCHGGFDFSDAVDYAGRPHAPPAFHNTGLYNVAGAFSFPLPNIGLYEHTRNPGRCRQVQGADTPQYRTDRPLHA